MDDVIIQNKGVEMNFKEFIDVTGKPVAINMELITVIDQDRNDPTLCNLYEVGSGDQSIIKIDFDELLIILNGEKK